MSMDLVSAASNANLQSVGGAVALNVLKKALNTQAQTTLTLLQAVPAPAPVNNGPVGSRIDVRA